MAEERIDPSEFYKDDPDKDNFLPLSYFPEEEIAEANRQVKEERSEELGLGTPDANLLKGMQAAQEKVNYKATVPVTSLDFERIADEQGGPSLNTIAPRDIGAVGLVPTAVKATPIARDIFYQSGDEQVSGIRPEDSLWSTYDSSGQPMPEGTELRFVGKKKKPSVRDDMELYTGEPEDLKEENSYSGTILVQIPTGDAPLDLYINMENRSMEEIDADIKTLRTKWREREGMDLPNPFFKSSPEMPITFTNYGINIRAETNALNDVKGYPDNIVKMYLSRGAQKTFGPFWDIIVDQGIGNAASWLLHFPAATVNFLGESISTKGRFGQQYETRRDAIWASRDNWADSIPSTVDILRKSIKQPTLKEFAAGEISFDEESLARFIEGKNRSFIEKVPTDYMGGLLFTKVIDRVVFPLIGRGPKAAETFVALIRGDLALTSPGKVAREINKVFKGNKQLKTGKELFFNANRSGKGSIKSVKSDLDLLKEWNALTDSGKDKWASQALNLFLKTRIDSQKGWISKKIVEMGNKSRWSTGVSIPTYAKNTRLQEKGASIGGVAGEEAFGPWGYLVGSISTAGGQPFMMNSNWYARTKNNQIGSFALAPIEFGEGFASGFDALAFFLSGKRPMTTAQFRNASDILRKEGVPAALIEEEVFRRFAIQNPARKLNTLGSFLIIDKDGTERMAGPSDPEWKKLNELVLDINKITDPIQKNRIVSTLETFLNIQNGFADEIAATGQQWLKNNPGASLRDHPLNRLGASLFEVLDLITTRSAAESMVEGPTFGIRKGLNLSHVERRFQERKDQLLAIGEYVADAVKYMNTYKVSEGSRSLLEGVEAFTKSESLYVDTVTAELKSLPTVFGRIHNTTSFNSGTRLTDESQFVQDYFNNDIEYQLYKKDFAAAKESLIKLEVQNRTKVFLILEHMKNNPKTHTEAGRVNVYNGLLDTVNAKIKTEAVLVYAPFLRAAAKSKSRISGEEIDNLFLSIDSIVNSSPADRLGKEVLPAHEASSLEEVFGYALKNNGDKVRAQLQQAYPDLTIDEISKQLNIPHLDDDISLYKYFLKNKDVIATSENVFLKVVKESFGNLEIDATTIATMDRVIRAERSLLLGKIRRGIPLTPDEKGTLSKYFQIIGKDEDSTGSLGIVISKRMGDEVFKQYKASTRIYASAIANRRWGDFNRIYEKTERVNKQIPEAGDGFSRGTSNVYTMDENAQMLSIGEALVENPARGHQLLVEKIGSIASVNGKQTTLITTAEQADTYRVIARLSINTYLEKKFKKQMQALLQDSSKGGIKYQEITGEIAESFKAFSKGGHINNAFNELEKLSTIPEGAMTWTGEIDNAGKLVFSTDVAWTKNSQGKTLSSLKDNYGKPVLLNDDTIDDIFFTKDIQLMIDNNSSIRKELKSLNELTERNEGKLIKFVQVEEAKITRNHKVLIDWMSQNVGLTAAPEGITGSFNITNAVESLVEDGTGRRLEQFIEHLTNLKKPDSKFTKSGSGGYVLKGGAKQRKEQAMHYAESIIQHKFVNDMLVDTGMQRIIKHPDGSTEMVNSYAPDLAKINAAKEKYGPILETFMPPEQVAKYIRIAELSAITGSVGSIGIGARKMVNVPQYMSISSMMSRGMNMARHVVSPQWVGVDALVRKARMTSRNDLASLLLTNSSAQHNGVTVIDAVHAMLVQGNYSVKHATVLKKLLPEMIYQSQLEFTGFGEIYDIPIPLIPQFKKSDRYAPRAELGDKPLIAREGESSENKLKNRIVNEFGSWPKFINAIRDGSFEQKAKARYYQGLVNRKEGSSLQNQMDQLLN